MDGEFDLIRRFCLPLADVVNSEAIVLGTGDDCAVLSPPPGKHLVVSTDNLVAGVHFLPDQNAADVGWRSLAVNLSDLAAMGASPGFFTCALTMPDPDEQWIALFVEGLSACMREFQIPIVGGNLTRGPLNICITVHGWVDPGRALARGGAKVGDRVYVTGYPGAAAAGLAMLKENADSADSDLLGRFLRPVPRIQFGQLLSGIASAAIDVSDGLLADLGHLADSSDVAVAVRAAAIPCAESMKTRFSARQCQDWMLAGGDDYELCFTVPESRAGDVPEWADESATPVTCIGEIVQGQGVWLVDESGNRSQHDGTGYQHF